MKKLRILFIVDKENYPLKEVQIREMLQSFDRMNTSVEVVCFRNSKLKAKLLELGYPTTVVKTRAIYTFLTAVRILRMARQKDIDVIHAFGTKSALIAAFVSRILKIHFLYSAFTWSGNLKSGLRLAAERSLQQFLVKQSLYTFAPSDKEARYGQRYYKFDSRKVITGNNIDAPPVKLFSDIKQQTPHQEKMNVGYVFSEEQSYGFSQILTSIEYILNANPNFNFHFFHLPEKHIQLIKTRKYTHPINFDQMHFHANCSTSELLKKIDILLIQHRSISCDDMIIKAMAMGKILVSPYRYIRNEFIHNNINAILYDKDDVFSLTHCILEIGDNATKRQRISENARVFAKLRFSINQLVEQMQHVYTTLHANSREKRLAS